MNVGLGCHRGMALGALKRSNEQSVLWPASPHTLHVRVFFVGTAPPNSSASWRSIRAKWHDER
jgi:hypothetical protein